jgi:phage terminase large subunit
VTPRDVMVAVAERWHDHPDLFVREVFDLTPATPDEWQDEALQALGRQDVSRLAVKSCKGPGKTCFLAWAILWFLTTRHLSLVGATSITGDNLSDNLWAELSRWMHRSTLLSSIFEWTKTRVQSRERPADWFATARTWPKQANEQSQADALAGLHADHIMFCLDEAGGIPQAVAVTAEAILANEGGEAKLLITGNPTHLEGPLYRACNADRAHWYLVTITGDPDNPKRSPRISLEYARQQIQSYGRDNPWVQVNILGEFPPSSINSLLGIEEVEVAMRRKPPMETWDFAQRRLGVDAARFGDDPWVIFPRQGLMSWMPQVMRNPRTTDVAARIQQVASRWKPEFIFVDDTGHWGHGTLDICLQAGLPVIPVIYSQKSTNPRYSNVRSQMYLAMAEWVQRGGALPNAPDLVAELTTPTYTYLGGAFVLEPKDEIKKRLGRSPNLADALAQTFFFPDQPADMVARFKDRHHARTTREEMSEERDRFRARTEFDPFEVGHA